MRASGSTPNLRQLLAFRPITVSSRWKMSARQPINAKSQLNHTLQPAEWWTYFLISQLTGLLTFSSLPLCLRLRSEALQFEGLPNSQSRPLAACPVVTFRRLSGPQRRSVNTHQTNQTRASLPRQVILESVCSLLAEICAARPAQSPSCISGSGS